MPSNRILRWVAGLFLVLNLAAAGVVSASAQAGQRGTVEITVWDQHGHPVDGAEFNFLKLQIFDQDDNTDIVDDDGDLTDEEDLTDDDVDDLTDVDVVDDDIVDDVTDDDVVDDDLTDGILDTDLLDDTADLTLPDDADDVPPADDTLDFTNDDVDAVDDIGPDLTDSPDLTSDLTDLDADLPDDTDTGDLTLPQSGERSGANASTGSVSTLSFANHEDGSNVESYLLEPGNYKVTQVLTGHGCDFVDPFRVNVDADETTEVTVVLNCDDSADDGDDGDDGDDDGTVVTKLPSTGNGADSGLMNIQMLFVMLSLVGALGLAASFGWSIRNSRK
jgi:hypothetical protein